MGITYDTTAHGIEQMKEGLMRVIRSLKTFRTALAGSRQYFMQVVYPTPVEEMTAHHQLVFKTAITLRSQDKIIGNASALIRFVRHEHYDRMTRTWDDDDLKDLVSALQIEARGCSEETKVMLQELGERFTIDVRLHYEDEIEEGEIAETRPGETRIFLGRLGTNPVRDQILEMGRAIL